MKIDIIIPVYNEGENIVKLLKEIEKKVSYNFKILICYDNENDSTLNYLKNKNIINNEILYIKNPDQGPNSAIIEGINKSSEDIILVYMADDFENVHLINDMANLIKNGNHLVIPSRFVEGGKMLGAKRMKKAVTVIGSYLIYYIARIPFRDCTNAFKMFSRVLKNTIKLKSRTGFTFALEMVVKSYIQNLKIIEIPSSWIEVENRKSNFKVLKWLPNYLYWLFFAIIKNLFRFKKTK